MMAEENENLIDEKVRDKLREKVFTHMIEKYSHAIIDITHEIFNQDNNVSSESINFMLNTASAILINIALKTTTKDYGIIGLEKRFDEIIEGTKELMKECIELKTEEWEAKKIKEVTND